MKFPREKLGIATSTMPTIPTNLPTPNVQKTQGFPSTPYATYNAIDEANMKTLASDPLPYPQKAGQPISQPGTPNQVGNMNIQTTITPHGIYPQDTFQPISDPGSMQGASVPPSTRRSRLPVVILAILVVILAGLVLTLVITPIGRSLLGGSNNNTDQNQPGSHQAIQRAIREVTSLLLLLHKACLLHQSRARQRVLHEHLFPHHSFWDRIQLLSTSSMKAMRMVRLSALSKATIPIIAKKLRLARQLTRMLMMLRFQQMDSGSYLLLMYLVNQNFE